MSYFNDKIAFEKSQKAYEQAANLLAAQVEALLSIPNAIAPKIAAELAKRCAAFREAELGKGPTT